MNTKTAKTTVLPYSEYLMALLQVRNAIEKAIVLRDTLPASEKERWKFEHEVAELAQQPSQWEIEYPDLREKVRGQLVLDILNHVFRDPPPPRELALMNNLKKAYPEAVDWYDEGDDHVEIVDAEARVIATVSRKELDRFEDQQLFDPDEKIIHGPRPE